MNLNKHMRRAGIVIASIWRKGTGKFSMIVLGLWVLVALVSLVWTPRSLWDTDGFNVWSSPSSAHWLGTDGTGADVFSWLMAGSATNLLIALLSAAVATLIGTLLIAAMLARGPRLSANAGSSLGAHAAVVGVDALISIPTILVALMLAVPFGASIWVIVAACGLSYGLNLARVARPAALLAANSQYAQVSRHAGASFSYIFRRHVLGNIRPVMTVQLSLAAGTSVLAEAGLTYLGVGVPSGTPSWGHSLATSAKFITAYPATVLWIGLAATLAVLAINLFGDCLRDACDPLANPRLREQPAKEGSAWDFASTD